jgi:hypothetical protein
MIGSPNFTFGPNLRDSEPEIELVHLGPNIAPVSVILSPLSVLVPREVLELLTSRPPVDGPFSLFLMDRYRGYVFLSSQSRDCLSD